MQLNQSYLAADRKGRRVERKWQAIFRGHLFMERSRGRTVEKLSEQPALCSRSALARATDVQGMHGSGLRSLQTAEAGSTVKLLCDTWRVTKR